LKMWLNRISFKISLFTSALILSVIIVMSQMILREQRESLISQLRIRSRSFAMSAREAFSPKLDLFNLHLIVNNAAKEKGVEYAFVRNETGKILSHSVAKRIGEIDRKNMAFETEIFKNLGEGNYFISAPIFVGSKNVGSFSVMLTKKSVDLALSASRREILAISLVSLLAAVAGIILIVGWLMRPVPLLAQAARKIGEGSLDISINWKSSDEMGLLTSAFNQMVKGLKERDYIKRVFGRYVSKEIAETLLSGKIALGGETREIAVLFADIRDFSKLSLEIRPQEIVSLLNAYFSLMTRVIQHRGGTLDKFVGDGLMAIFGAPLALEKPCERAVKAAQEMKWALSSFNKDREIKKLPPIKIGICVTYGRAVVGNIGSEDRTEYTAIGAPVNLAFRLEGLNKRLGTEFIVSKQAYEQTHSQFNYKKLGMYNIRGWAEPVESYEVLG